MADSRTLRSSLWARWGILAATLVTAAALLFTSWSNYARTRDTSDTLIRGQGELLLESATQYLRALGRPPNQSDLDTLFGKLEPRGVRFVGFDHPTGVRITAGRARADGPPPHRPPRLGRPIDMWRVGSVVRLHVHHGPPAAGPVGWRPPPRARPPGPGRDFAPRRPEPRFGPRDDRPLPPPHPGDGPARDRLAPDVHDLPPHPGPPRLPPLSFELEPVQANELVATARRSLLTSAVTSAAMLAAALLAFAFLRRRERAEAELARERHLASLGEMSAVLAHELRNPLASLKGNAQLLAETLPDDGKPKQKADRVVAEAIRLENLTSDLLAFVRTGQIERTESDPVARLRAAATEVGGDITIHDDGAPSRWSMDGDRLHQVLTNLIRNAVQASPAGERVDARVSVERNQLIYEIADRGAGIPTDQREAIFEPFRTTRVHGTGLGLAVAKRVVELHGGTIRAHNRPGGGALFRVQLPRGT